MVVQAMGSRRVVAYSALVVLLVSGALGGAAVFFQVSEHGSHAHAGLAAWQETFALVVDGVGFVLAFVLAAQAMLGYRLFSVRRSRFRPVHVALAWTVIAIMLAHGAGAIAHTFQGPLEVLPVWLDVLGVAIVALLTAQMVSGYFNSSPTRRARLVHVWVAIPVALVAAVHGVLAVWHTVAG